jgi:hypothetical protein
MHLANVVPLEYLIRATWVRLHDIIIRQHEVINVVAQHWRLLISEVSVDVLAEQYAVPLDHDGFV